MYTRGDLYYLDVTTATATTSATKVGGPKPFVGTFLAGAFQNGKYYYTPNNDTLRAITFDATGKTLVSDTVVIPSMTSGFKTSYNYGDFDVTPSGVVYVSATNGGNRYFYKYDPANPPYTMLLSGLDTGTTGRISQIAFGPYNTLWSVQTGTGSLFKLDYTTPAVPSVVAFTPSPTTKLGWTDVAGDHSCEISQGLITGW